jgi:hypothetical protein
LDGGDAEPKNHLTLKLDCPRAFKQTFGSVVARAAAQREMAGYVEGEYIALDREIEDKPFDDRAAIPFSLGLRHLEPGTFRQSEIHIALCPERSDTRLLRNLTEIGLATIYIPKPWGLSLIFTAQGTRRTIRDICSGLVRYLETAGGAARCSVKEERIAKWWVSGEDVRLPAVVHEIKDGGGSISIGSPKLDASEQGG